MNLPNAKKIELSRRTKIISAVVVALMIGLYVLDAMLIGKVVDSEHVSMAEGSYGTLTIKDVGKKHLVEIDTDGLASNKRDKGKALSLRLEDPKGKLVYESSEWMRRKKRYFSFPPKVAGDFKITVQRSGLQLKGRRNSAFVKVRVGDRRFLTRVLAVLPF